MFCWLASTHWSIKPGYFLFVPNCRHPALLCRVVVTSRMTAQVWRICPLPTLLSKFRVYRIHTHTTCYCMCRVEFWPELVRLFEKCDMFTRPQCLHVLFTVRVYSVSSRFTGQAKCVVKISVNFCLPNTFWNTSNRCWYSSTQELFI